MHSQGFGALLSTGSGVSEARVQVLLSPHYRWRQHLLPRAWSGFSETRWKGPACVRGAQLVAPLPPTYDSTVEVESPRRDPELRLGRWLVWGGLAEEVLLELTERIPVLLIVGF